MPPTKKSSSSPTKKPNKPRRIKSVTSKTSKPTGVKRQAVPQLPDVAPELKEHIVNQVVPVVNDNYWQTLAWVGVAMLGILVATGSATWLASLKNRPARPVAWQPAIVQSPLNAIAPLTGLPVADEVLTRRPWAVVVENFFTVRPQAGLSAADIVIESPTEGGITRLLAIYQSQWPKLVGPVRSARSYFNDWIRPLAPFYSHSGGSDRALQQLRLGYGGIIDINEFFHGAAYSREAKFKAPHNLFTTPERFFIYLQDNDFELTGELPKLSFVTELPEAPSAANVTVPYLPEEYSVTYEYQPATNNYQRLVDGTTQLDASTNQVLAIKNIVVIFTDITPIPNDQLLRVELRTLGRGDARIYTGGKMYAGSWHKTTADSMLEFTGSDNQSLPLQPGNTWISVIDSAEVVNFTVAPNIPLSF